MNTDYAAVVFILGTVLLVLFALFLIFFLVIHKQRQYKYLIEKQQLEHRYESQLLQSQIEVQEQAFEYFSTEIHDNVGQILSLAKLYLYKIGRNSPNDKIEADAQKGTDLITKAIADLRNLSHTANGNYILNAELSEVIKKELDYISSAKNINCNFISEGESYQLDSEKKLLVFRIIQESIGNALKHGNPGNIIIQLSYKPDLFSVSVKDDGEGFDMQTLDNSKRGLGLSNMQMRADLLKGRFNVSSGKDKGTTIKLDIPV